MSIATSEQEWGRRGTEHAQRWRARWLGVALVTGVLACNSERAASTSSTPVAPTVAASSPAPAASSAPPSAAAGSPSAAPAASEGTSSAPAPVARQTDVIATSAGPLSITPIQHATVLFQFAGKNIYVDPWSKGNYDGLPRADVILISDIHPDHLDPATIDLLRKSSTIVVGPKAVDAQRHVDVVMKNGDKKTVDGLAIEAVPMYNLKRGPSAGQLFHDKGRGNGYVITFGDKRVYLSGDTECTKEMKGLSKIDVAFVCMNLPYTMPPDEAAECVNAFAPKIVYPYHYKGSDLELFEAKIAKGKNIEVRLRNWYPNPQ